MTNMLPPPISPQLAQMYAKAYARGRQDFVKTTVAALSEPAFKDVRFTSAQMAEMLQSASDKCDTIKPGEKQN